MMPILELGPLPSRASILLLIMTSLFSVDCASAGRTWSSLAQPTQQISRRRVIPGNWEAVEALRPGTPIAVTLNNGGRIRGVFKALHPMILEIDDQVGRDSSVARSDIANIVGSGASDSSTNGALIGAGIGLAAAGIILGAIGSSDGYVLPSAKWGAPLLLSGAGGLLGIVIDRAHRDEQLLYEAVRAPIVLCGNGGYNLTFSASLALPSILLLSRRMTDALTAASSGPGVTGSIPDSSC
jgi:hypothetical protein